PEAPRCRILCPFSEELPSERRAAMLGRLNGLLHTIGVELSGESWTLSQSYYYGSVRHNPAHQARVIEGTPLDLHDELDENWLGKSATIADSGNGEDRQSGPADEAELARRIVSGENFHESTTRLIGLWAYAGMPLMEARTQLLALYDTV